MSEIEYVGNELELFQHANTWKSYYGRFLRPFIKGRVLEVGAGIGATTAHLCTGSETSWLCLEPDPHLFKSLEDKIASGALPPICSGIKGVTSDLPAGSSFDAILYIDVIEHIEHDREELARAAKLLAPGGHLIVLVPANQSLYSPFDKAIGHYRRYNKPRLLSAAPSTLQLEKIRYMDAVGLMASFMNKYFLKKPYPSLGEVKFWDTAMVPISKLIDPVIGFSAGKALIGIWKNQ